MSPWARRLLSRRLLLWSPGFRPRSASGLPAACAVSMATAACAGPGAMDEALSRAVPPLPPYETREKAAAPAGAALEQRSAEFMRYYGALEGGRPRAQLLSRLARDFGVEHGRVADLSAKVLRLLQPGGGGDEAAAGALLQAEDRLRHYLTPRYRGLFQHLGRQEGGLRFLVELRRDLLDALAAREADGPHVRVSRTRRTRRRRPSRVGQASRARNPRRGR